MAQAYDLLGVTQIKVRIRNNAVDVYPLTTIKEFTVDDQDVVIRVEAEIIGDDVHCAVVVDGVLTFEGTYLFDVAKTNTRAILFTRLKTADTYASRFMHSIQIDTNRDFLP
jgi:hypothetical protein